MTPEQVKILERLANGIIPADEMDEGAQVVNAGRKIAQRIEAGINAKVYLSGLEFVAGKNVPAMNDEQVHELLGVIREKASGFFKQLRMDVSALYLGDQGVWEKIGFGGPSSETGGYRDFDQVQVKVHGRGAHATDVGRKTMSAPAVLPMVAEFVSKPRRMLIGSEWREAASGEWIETPDPATGKTIGKFPAGGAADVDAAVVAARNAFKGAWKKVTPYERGRLMQKVASGIEKYAEELAQLIVLDNGKPLWEAKKEVATAVAWVDYYAGWCTKLLGDTIPLSLPGSFLNYTTREPLGVVAGVTPPNYPLTMPLYKIAPAIATGNTIIVKPAEQTSLVALVLGEIILGAGVPEGVVNIVTGYGETAGAALATHNDVDKITFTGSTDVGRILVKASAGNLKRVSLELGGKSPNIVFADADLEAALKGVFMGIFFCQGEICSAGSRLFIEETIYEEFTKKLAEMARGVKLGHGLDAETKMGPLVSAEQQKRVLGFLEEGRRTGAQAVCGGKAPDGNLAGGFFVEPTVFTKVDREHRLAKEEIFGPVACAMPFKDLPDAVAKGNDTPFGLAAGVWTRDVKKALQAAAALEAGTVWVNCYNAFDNASPWGGMKQSGWGREKGPYGLDLFTQVKSVVINYT